MMHKVVLSTECISRSRCASFRRLTTVSGIPVCTDIQVPPIFNSKHQIFAKVSEEITQMCKEMSPSEEQYSEQRNFISRMQETISAVMRGAVVAPFGSAVNGFWSPNSDIDVCVQVAGCMSRASQVQALRQIASALHTISSHNIEPRFGAKVPIIHWAPRKEGYLACDISINNSLAVINSRLIGAYNSVDPRFQQLGRVIKHWAKSRSINDRSKGTISSFSLLLMLVHFLQRRRPPLLPSLQDMSLEFNDPLVYCDGVDVRFSTDSERIQLEMKRLLKTYNSTHPGEISNEPVGYLLYDFFKYYAQDYDGGVIAIRDLRSYQGTHGESSRGGKTTGSENLMFVVDNPFEVGKDVANISQTQYSRIRQEFRRAMSIIKTAAVVNTNSDGSSNILESICSGVQPPRPEGPVPTAAKAKRRALPAGSHPLDPPMQSLGKFNSALTWQTR